MISGLRTILKIEDEKIKTIKQKEEIFKKIIIFQDRLQTAIKNRTQADDNLTQDINSQFSALCNMIYPEEMHPDKVAGKVYFHFADRDGNIKDEFVNTIPFSRIKIRWDLIRKNINKVFFIIDDGNQYGFIIEFTSEKIKFLINYRNDILVPFFKKYDAIKFTQSEPAQSDYNQPVMFEILYEEHYSKITDELAVLFSGMGKILSK